MLRDLRNFLLRGNVLDLAVGVILGVAFNDIVSAFANDFLLNIIAAVFGQPDFSELSFFLGDTEVNYGTTITAIVNFLLIGTTLFFILRAATRLRLEPDDDDKVTPPSEEVVLLREIRDALSTNPVRRGGRVP